MAHFEEQIYRPMKYNRELRGSPVNIQYFVYNKCSTANR